MVDILRDRCKGKLAIVVPTLDRDALEGSIFAWCKKQAEYQGLDSESKIFKCMYVSKSRQIVDNLDSGSYIHNLDLKDRVVSGTVSCNDLATMTPQELFPDVWLKLINDKKSRDEKEFSLTASALTDKYKCRRCGSRKITFYERQTRSADEGTSSFFTCLSCGNQWKVA
jgi:DNA-directed RNA polymerase subunit M/transcription elongation factor TFIIS